MPLALYLLALAVFAMGTSEFMLAGLVPHIAADLDVPVGTAGLLTSAFAAGMVIGAPVMAALTRRLAVRATLVACIALFAVAHVVAAVTPDFAVLFATRVLSALANAGFLAVALGAATRLVAPDRKGRALAVLLSGTTVATVVGVPAGALLGTAFGWRSTFWAVALLCIPAALGVTRAFGPRARGDASGAPAQVSLRSELAQLRTPRVALAMLLAALLNAGTFAVLTYLAPIVTDTAGLSPWWVPIALALFGAGSFLGVTVAGRLSDAHPQLVILGGGLLLLLGWLALAVFGSLPPVALILLLTQGALGFAVGSALITRVLYAASGAPTMGGSYATAALNVGAVVGSVCGAASLGTAAGALGPVWVAVATTAGTLLLAVPVLRLLTPGRSHQTA